MAAGSESAQQLAAATLASAVLETAPPSSRPPRALYLVLERTMSFHQWLSIRSRTFGEVLAMMQGVAGLLHRLHAARCAHRDVSANSVRYVLASTEWRFCDVSVVAPLGAAPQPPVAALQNARASREAWAQQEHGHRKEHGHRNFTNP